MTSLAVTVPIDQAVALLDGYVHENARKAGIGKQNLERDQIFTTLIASIERIKGSSTLTHRQIIERIIDAIQTAANDNRLVTTTVGLLARLPRIKGRRSSVQALTNALDIITAPTLLATADAIDVAVQEQKDLQAEREAARQRQEAGTRQQQEEARTRQQQEEARTRQQQEEARTRQQQEEAARTFNPIALIAEAIKSQQVHELLAQHPRIVSKIGALLEQPPAELALSNEQQAFARDLRKEFQNNHLPIGEGILNLIVRSPLADNYATLLQERNALALRKMIQKIADTLRMCFYNNSESLQDLHQVFLAKDIDALHGVLRLFYGKQILGLSSAERVEELREPGRADRFASDVAAALNSRLTGVGPLDMRAVGSAIERVAQLMPSQDPRSAAASTTQATSASDGVPSVPDIRPAINHLFQMMKLSSVISALIADIMVNSLEMISQAYDVNARHDHAQLRHIAGKGLTPQFKLLIELTQVMKASEQKLISAIAYLHEASQKTNDAQNHQDVLRLQAGLRSLFANYQTWHAEHKNKQQELDHVLSQLYGALELDASAGLEVAGRLIEASVHAQAEAEIKATIRADIMAVQGQLSDRTNKADTTLPQALLDRVSRATDARCQSVSLEFVVKLANRCNEFGEDYEPAIDLVNCLLKTDGLFTPQLQAKLLRQPNVAVLLSLQKFLDESRIQVTSAQLSKVWDSLRGSNPDFELLKPLQARLGLNSDAVIAIIANLSRSWGHSLKMLTQIFNGENAGTQAVFLNVLDAAKNDPSLIESIFKIYEALRTHQPEMMDDFFNPTNMAKLIIAIQQGEARFADELASRIEASPYAPFSPEENWVHLLSRTVQYDARNLSYADPLDQWQKENPKPYAFFDVFSQIILGRFDEAQYDGAHQKNTNVTRSAEQGEPLVRDTNATQWHLACAHVNYRGVNYRALDEAAQQEQASRVNLSPERQLILQVMEQVLTSAAVTLVTDRETNPSLILLQNGPIMSGYLCMTIKRLEQESLALHALATQVGQLRSEGRSEESDEVVGLRCAIADRTAELPRVVHDSLSAGFEGEASTADSSLRLPSSVANRHRQFSGSASRAESVVVDEAANCSSTALTTARK